MQELISSARSRWSYPLNTIKIREFNKLEKNDKATQIQIRIEALEKVLEKKHMKGMIKIELGEEPTSEKNIRYLNRMITTIRGEVTSTNIILELYEIIIKISDSQKSIHHEIFKALGGEVPISSIRRVLSQYRRGIL